MNLVGERIGLQLAKLDMSQAELARRVGLTQPTINGLVNGRATSSSHLHKIARELQTTAAYLTGETDDPDSEVPDDALTSEEREILDHFRNLTPKEQAAARQLIRSLAGSEPVTKPAPTVHAPGRSFSHSGQSKGKAA